MEKSVEFEIADYIKEVLEMKEVEPEGYSPLTLAYIGDSIYDLIITEEAEMLNQYRQQRTSH